VRQRGATHQAQRADLLPHIDTSALQPAASLGTNVKDPIHSAVPTTEGAGATG
jgi:hypothetical protein